MPSSKLVASYFTVALRNLRRNKFYSFINILGLATGIACFALIAVYVKDELAYDTFHSRHGRIFRVCEKLDSEEGQGENSSSQPFPVAQALLTDHSELVEQAVRFFNFQEPSHTLQYKDIKINEKRTFFADSGVFNVFDFPLTRGDRNKALAQVNSIVVTQELARKYFGSEDPMGKVLKFDGKIDLLVTGVFDGIPAQSHIHFDCLVSFVTLKSLLGPNIGSKNWVWNPCWTYVLLKNREDARALEKQFPAFIKKHFPDFIIPQATLYLQNLADIHLTSKLDYELEPNSDKDDIYIFGAIGIFILIIAGINFMNLATARSARRAREVGMRKVFGSYRSQLMQQFLGESLLMCFIALVLALLLVILLLPMFSALSSKELPLSAVFNPSLLGWLVGVTLLVGLLSGIYPALFLSAFDPARVLRGSISSGKGSVWFRQGLVVLQFAISFALIIGTAIIYRQLAYMRNADVGFNKDEVVVLPVRPPMAAAYMPFAEELRTGGRIKHIASMNDVFGVSHNTHEYNYEGMPPGKQWIYFPSLIVSSDFIKAMGIKIVAGRDFDRNIKSDDSLSVIINEAMVKHLGWGTPENALGKQFFTPNGSERVIGVAKDFNFVSLKEPVGPFVVDMAGRNGRVFWTKYLVIRIPGENVKATMAYIEQKWNAFSKEYPFEYFFLGESINRQYQAQASLGRLVGYFAVLAVFIACLGLFALSSFAAEQRTREIGIRKVLGAPVLNIVQLMSREFLKLVLLSALISWPLTYYIMSSWLDNFAYRINIGFAVFAVSGLLGLFIALLTVSFRALQSAYRNPVSAIRYE